MTTVLPLLIVIGFGFAVGFLTLLVLIERPVRGLFSDVDSPRVNNDDVRRIQAAVHLVATANGPAFPAMFIAVATISGATRAWLQGFHWAAVVPVVLMLGFIVYAVTNIGAAIHSATTTDPQGEIGEVRRALRKEALFHHTGLAACVVLVLVQLGLTLIG